MLWDYLLANKDWVFDGWGVAGTVLLISAVTSGGRWLYKKYRPSPQSPQPISIPHPIEVQLLPTKKEALPSTEPNPEVTGIVKRFNMVLFLMNQQRTHNQYTVAKLARIMQLNSVSELEDIFLGKREPSFGFIDRFCGCFGVYKEWLINGEITPYYNDDDMHHLMPLEYFDEIKSSKSDRIFFVTCNSPARETFIVLKFSNWKYKILHRTWPISDEVGTTGRSQIFSMYCLIKALENDDMAIHYTGRMLDKQSFNQLSSGQVFPWKLLDSPNCYANTYLDSFTDVYHEYPIADRYEVHHGKELLYAQSVVRYYLEEHEKGKAALPRLHIPQHCITCRALSKSGHTDSSMASAIPVPAEPGESTVAPAEKGIAGLSQTLNSPGQSVSHYDFFIAYATPDRRLAQDLCWYLQDDSCKVFLDVEDLSQGASWPLALKEALEASRAIVVLVSTHTDDAFYQQEEIVRAIQLARNKPNAHTVIPVILEKLPQGAVSMPYGMSILRVQDATRSGGLKRVATELVTWLSSLSP